MRVCLAILIFLSLCFQCFIQLGIIGWYKINTEAITEIYCVNKDKPQLHCKGKCHLKNQLDKTTDKDSKSKTTSAPSEWTVFIVPQPEDRLVKHFASAPVFNPLLQQNYFFLYLHSVFRPPQLA